MSNLTEAQRGQIVGLYKSGASYRSIVGFSATTVCRTVKNFQERDGMADLPRSGRPKILNTDHRQAFKNIVKRNNHKSAEQIKNHFNQETGLHVSTKTVRRILHEINMFSRVPASKPLINEQQRIKRLNWWIVKEKFLIEFHFYISIRVLRNLDA